MVKARQTTDLLRTDLQQSLAASAIDVRKLSVFQRILLTTDGMVTEMLEAYLQEHMVVSKLAQGEARTARVVTELELDEGDAIMHRAILLTGESSHRHHLYAESAIAVDRLIKPIRDGLLNSRKPIGMLIQENRLETFREILVCEEEPADDLAEYFGISRDALLLSRTYRVLAHGHAIMLITEKFPEQFFMD
ncbi:MAG: DUF98 domain-containing protein [Gammaproteobacteria bacterium]|nr:DUF98 domain-containing protein [Gammaproteobacteria bacterium]